MYMYWRSDLLHIFMILTHLCVPAYPFFSLLSFHCMWQSYMYLRSTAHTPSLTWSCRTYTQSFFFSLVSFHCTWHSYTLLSYDLVTLMHSVFPCLRKVVRIRDFICLNLICISHFKIIFHEQKNLHSVSLFVCAHYLAAHTSSSHLIELKQWLPCLFFTKKTNPISLSKSVLSLSMNLLVATGESTKQLTTTTASTCKFRNILTINNNTLLLIVEKHAHYEGICPATFLN